MEMRDAVPLRWLVTVLEETYVEWNDEVERMSRLDRFWGRARLSGDGNLVNSKKKPRL